MEAIQAAADQFMKDNPGVKINIETMAWGDFNTKWNAGITTGDLPDISTAQNTGEVVEMLNAGVLAPMDSTIDAIPRSGHVVPHRPAGGQQPGGPQDLG